MNLLRPHCTLAIKFRGSLQVVAILTECLQRMRQQLRCVSTVILGQGRRCDVRECMGS